MTTSQTRQSRRTSITIRNIRLTSLFKPEDIIHHTDAARLEEILGSLLRHLALEYGIGNLREAKAGVIESVGQAMMARRGLAVPYGRLEKVTEPLVAMATSEAGFDFEGEKLHLVVLVLVPADLPGAYKQVLSGIERACPDDDSAALVASLQSPLLVWQHFDAGGHHLPDHLQARHIMDTVKTSLSTGDSLRTAIDRFLAFNTPELPVVNSEGELVGVVTIKRLVRTCLPDYLMWVGDMTPYLNFEPLAEVIRNESTTWLRDIMTSDFAHVEEDAPAILAMKEIGQKESLNAYVLRGRKLVGIIRMLDFVKSVLR
ncbi:MAG: CBS domain-containing protein [Planctomycetaceae bacterium]|nr:CBS domain-containing protein [Planctomycetaceae bacterium]